MADREFTLFELHLHEGLSLSASDNRARNTGSLIDLLRRSDGDADVDEDGNEDVEIRIDADDADADETDETDEAVEELEEEIEELEESRGRGMIVLLALGVAIGAYVAMRFLGGDDLDELDDLADAAPEADAGGDEAADVGDADGIVDER